MDQNSQMLFGSISQEPLDLPKFLSFLDSLLYNANIIFQKDVNNIWDGTKHANFWVEGAVAP